MACTVKVPSVGGLVFKYGGPFQTQSTRRLASEVVPSYCKETQPPFKPDLNTGLKLEPLELYSDLKYL